MILVEITQDVPDYLECIYEGKAKVTKLNIMPIPRGPLAS